jgi:gamma-D-glutamyl-L-lysine dipeptidyl-peptidase
MERAVVRVSVAPVLAARSMTSEQVTQAVLGAPVSVLERSARWARVRMEDEYEGWISAGHLVPAFGERREWVRMTDLWVNLRTRPDYRMPARVVATVGVRLPLQARKPGWLGVTLPGGGVGWLEETRGQVEAEEAHVPPPSAGELLETARRFLEVPYLWGGCSPWGLDCSGFVQLVYRLHGIRLPRDAGPQAGVGEPVALDGHAALDAVLAPGDAVFFHGEEARDRITHVALALGDGEFIHAAGGDRVRIDAWDDSPYTRRVVGARRYLDCPAPRPSGTPGAWLDRTQAVVP